MGGLQGNYGAGQLGQQQYNEAMAVRAPSQPAMMDVVESLEKELCGLEAEVERLVQRLEPISTVTPTTATDKAPLRGGHGSIVNSLWTQVVRVEQLRRNVRYMLDTLDV